MFNLFNVDELSSKYLDDILKNEALPKFTDGSRDSQLK